MKKYEDLKRPPIYGCEAADSRRTEFDIKNSVLFVNETRPDIVFLGDSITQIWELNGYFHKYGLVINRGIGGDVVHIIKERFEGDVLQLKPRLCVVMAGINNTWCVGESSLKEPEKLEAKKTEVFSLLEQSYRTILEMAKDYRQSIMLCSILPLNVKACKAVMPQSDPYGQNHFVLRVNKMIKELCNEFDVSYIDYHTNISAEDGCNMKDGISIDGIHPHVLGYNSMADTLIPYLNAFFSG